MPPDELGLEQAVDRLGQRIVVRRLQFPPTPVSGPAGELQDLGRPRASKLGVVCVNWQQICLWLVGLGP
jgi:hypothetical protein